LLAQWPTLRDAVLVDLNQGLDGPSLYTDERFARVQLQAETRQYLMQRTPALAARRLNLMLLRDAWHPALFSYDDAERQIRSSGRLLDKLHGPPKAEALTVHLRTCLRAETQRLLT
jgi:hypothetical protein